MEATELDELERLAEAARQAVKGNADNWHAGLPVWHAQEDYLSAFQNPDLALRLIAAARLQGDPGPLRGALERADADVSLIHDFLYGRGGTMDQAHAACWRIHDVLRPQIAALAASPPEPEPLDVDRLAKAMYAVWPGHPEGTGGTGGNAEAMLMWRVLDPAIYSDYLVNAIAAEYARLSESETPK